MQNPAEILDIIKEKRINVQEIERQSGIPSARLYKWLSGKGNPKTSDAVLLSKWASKHLDKVPNSEVHEKSQPLETAGFSVNLKDYVDEIKRSREFAERMLDKTISKVGLSLEEQSQLLHAMQADLLARTQVALDSLARLENSKKPPKLNEAADRISAESQGMIERKGNGSGDIDG